MCMDGTEPDLVCKGAVLTVCKQLHVWQRALVFLSSAFTEDWADLALFVWVCGCRRYWLAVSMDPNAQDLQPPNPQRFSEPV